MKLNLKGDTLLSILPNLISLCSRILLGLAMIIFGLNGFVSFIPIPEFHDFMKLLVDSGYIYLVKAIEIAGGACLLVPRTVNLGLLLITPIVVNIVAYHFFLDLRNWPVAVLLAIFNIVLLCDRSADFLNLAFHPSKKSE